MAYPGRFESKGQQYRREGREAKAKSVRRNIRASGRTPSEREQKILDEGAEKPSSQEVMGKTQGFTRAVPVIKREGETDAQAYQRSAKLTANLLQARYGGIKSVTVTQPSRRRIKVDKTDTDDVAIRMSERNEYLLQGTGVMSPNQITRALTQKETIVTRPELEQRAAFISTTQGAVLYSYKTGTSPDIVVGVYDPRINERFITKDFYPSPPKKSTSQKFFESPEALYGEYFTGLHAGEKIPFSDKEIRGLSFEEAKGVWFENPVATFGRNIKETSQVLPYTRLPSDTFFTGQTKVTGIIGGAVIQDFGEKPFKNIVFYGTGGAVGKGVGFAKGLWTGSKAQTFVATAPTTVKWAGRGMKIGAGSVVVGGMGGLIGYDIVKSGEPIARGAVIAKDFALFDAGFRTTYDSGYVGATKLKVVQREKVFERTLAKQERFVDDPQRLPFRVTKDAGTGKTILVEEVDITKQSRFVDVTVPKKSPLQEVYRVYPLAERGRGFSTNRGVPSSDLPRGTSGATKEAPFITSKVEILDTKTGEITWRDARGLPDLYAESEGRFVLVQKPLRERISVSVTEKSPTQTSLNRFGFDKKGQISIGKMEQRYRFGTEDLYPPPRTIYKAEPTFKVGGDVSKSGFSVVKSSVATRFVPASMTLTGLSSGQASFFGQRQFDKTIVQPKTMVSTGIKSAVGFAVKQDVITAQDIVTVPITTTPTGLRTPSTFTGRYDLPRPPRTRPPKPPKVMVGFQKSKKPSKKKRKGVLDLELGGDVYNPSLTSVILNIRGKKPSKLAARSGLVNRPLLWGMKMGKKKKKKNGSEVSRKRFHLRSWL